MLNATRTETQIKQAKAREALGRSSAKDDHVGYAAWKRELARLNAERQREVRTGFDA